MTRWRILLAAVAMCHAASAWAQFVIAIDFDRNDSVGINGPQGPVILRNVRKSTLTPAERAALVADVQRNYDSGVGPGKVKVIDGKAGDHVVIVDGNPDNGGQFVDGGKRAAGAHVEGYSLSEGGVTIAKKISIVYEGSYKNFADIPSNEKVNALGKHAGHETGHGFGLQHNRNSPPNKMSEGVTRIQNRTSVWNFGLTDAGIMNNNFPIFQRLLQTTSGTKIALACTRSLPVFQILMCCLRLQCLQISPIRGQLDCFLVLWVPTEIFAPASLLRAPVRVRLFRFCHLVATTLRSAMATAFGGCRNSARSAFQIRATTLTCSGGPIFASTCQLDWRPSR